MVEMDPVKGPRKVGGSDVNRLREALELYDAAEFKSEVSWPQPPIVAAARRFLALTETGRRVEWCETHKQTVMASAPWKCHRYGWFSPCSIVSKFLADYLTEEET